MKKAVIIHGYIKKEIFYKTEYSSSNMHWIPWLQNKLLQHDILTQTPELWRPFEPDYQIHKQQLDNFDINQETIIIAHSYGGGLVIKWLTETKTKIKKLVLVAPWLDVEQEKADLLKFEFNPNLYLQIEQGIHILESNNDMKVIQSSARFLRQNLIKAKFYDFENYGHFDYRAMKTVQFPELLEICLKDLDF